MDLPSGFLQWPLNAIFLASFAENKVTGFALMKMLKSFNMIPALAFFVSGNWQVLAGIMSAYWPMKMTWLADQGNPYGAYGAVGVAVNAAILLIMHRKFSRVMHR